MKNNKLLIMNGPGLSDLSNFNEMGYGHLTLDIVRKKCAETCKILGLKMDFRQTDDETELSRFLIEGIEDFDALIINPVGYSHASSVDYTIYSSAIKTITRQNKPVIEVHISNIFQQDVENTKPIHVPKCEVGFVSGLGIHSYDLAIRAVNKKLSKN
jgi:3-dehydroquinate dehydratase-2